MNPVILVTGSVILRLQHAKSEAPEEPAPKPTPACADPAGPSATPKTPSATASPPSSNSPMRVCRIADAKRLGYLGPRPIRAAAQRDRLTPELLGVLRWTTHPGLLPLGQRPGSGVQETGQLQTLVASRSDTRLRRRSQLGCPLGASGGARHVTDQTFQLG